MFFLYTLIADMLWISFSRVRIHFLVHLFAEIMFRCQNTLQVLIPVANGTEEIEVVIIIDILRRAKVTVIVASVERSIRISASQGTQIIADKLIGDAAGSKYDLIILPVRNKMPIIQVAFARIVSQQKYQNLDSFNRLIL